MLDHDLQQALTAVKARSAHHRRVRRAVAGSGCAVLIGAAGVGIISATTPERTLSTASGQDAVDDPGSTLAGSANPQASTGTEAPGTSVDGGVAAPTTSTQDATTSTTATSGSPGHAPTTTAQVQPPGIPPGPQAPTTTATVPLPTTQPVPGVPTPLAEARALWAAKGPASYQMTLQTLCFCGLIEPIRVTVLDGVVQPGADGALSIDDILDQAASIGPEGRIVELRVDRATGVPTYVDLDFVTIMADDEMTYVITDFVAIATDS